jgi:hypothetical protein
MSRPTSVARTVEHFGAGIPAGFWQDFLALDFVREAVDAGADFGTLACSGREWGRRSVPMMISMSACG